jgi:hypothetical protein
MEDKIMITTIQVSKKKNRPNKGSKRKTKEIKRKDNTHLRRIKDFSMETKNLLKGKENELVSWKERVTMRAF